MSSNARVMPTNNPLPIQIVKGKGLRVWDNNDIAYLDTFSGIAVLPLGHSHPSTVQTICEQSLHLIHTSNSLGHGKNTALAQVLAKHTGLDRAFFCNSGAEAVECALKIARRYGHAKQVQSPKVLVFDQGYHGRTLATLSATGFRWAHAGFEPLVTGFTRCPYNDLAAAQKILAEDDDIVAILVEPILGAAGVVIPDDNFLPGLRALCDQHEALLITDEVQAGLGRTGHFLSAQSFGVQPDVVSLAKGLAGGYPMGACLATPALGDLFTPGSHGSTFGGSPLACALALSFLDVLEKDNLMQQAADKGRLLLETLQASLGKLPIIKQIVGRGLMIGIHLNEKAEPYRHAALQHQLLLNVANQTSIRLLPAYTLTTADIHEMSEKLLMTLSETPNPN
jgi:acetylornithine aminotransferase